jgi:hypothetical protein
MEPQRETSSALEKCLLEFAQMCNSNTDIPRLLKNWDRYVHVKPHQSTELFTLDVAAGGVKGVLPGELQGRKTITVSAASDVLIEVFSGRLNPAEALISSGLEVYGAEEDVMKLDAITLVLWDS